METEAQTGQESPVEPQGYEEAAKGGSSQVSRAPAPLSLPLDVVKNPPANTGDTRDARSIPVLGRSLEEGMATHSSILTWRIPWTEEPGGLQSIELKRGRKRLK